VLWTMVKISVTGTKTEGGSFSPWPEQTHLLMEIVAFDSRTSEL